MTASFAEPPWLVADIGGTNARFGLACGPDRAVGRIERLRADAHAQLVDAVRAYLSKALDARTEAPPVQACFAVATPLGGDEVVFTNSAWRFSRSGLARELGLSRLHLLNDFEALALSLPRLPATALRAHGPLPDVSGTRAVIGPGTGLGVAGLVETASGWQALPGEGGHASLSAADAFEAAVIARARLEFDHVSAERLLSGIGLPLLHRAVAAEAGHRLDPAASSAEAIVQRGVEGSDPACVHTLSVFCAMLGSFAGNVALTLGARAGLYIGGGIVPRMADFFFASRFRERFEDKGRYRDYLRAIPTALILEPHAALTGAVLHLQQAQGAAA